MVLLFIRHHCQSLTSGQYMAMVNTNENRYCYNGTNIALRGNNLFYSKYDMSSFILTKSHVHMIINYVLSKGLLTIGELNHMWDH
jgi:hypothetical protein